MSNDFSDAMRGQFEAAQKRLAQDQFAEDFGAPVISRVRRRRAVVNTAVGGGTVVAVGAIAVAAMYLPRASTSPAASPSGCVTWTPSPDPYPVVTIAPDPSDFSYDVALPDGAGTMTITPNDGAFDVTLPDGSAFSAPRDPNSGAVIFKVPDLHLVVVATQDFSYDLKVSVGGVDAVVAMSPANGRPRLVETATPEPIADCDTTSGAESAASPFQCGFHMDTTYRVDPALAIREAGYKTVAEAAELTDMPGLTIENPVVTNFDPLVPYATAVNNEVPGTASGSGLDPASDRVSASQGATTGVAVVKVQDGVVVAVPNQEFSGTGPTPGAVVVGEGVTTLVFDQDYFATCPGVTSTAYATLYAVAGSQTIVRQEANESPIYVWQQLRGVSG